MNKLTIVLGNGETRAGFALSLLNDHTTYGCNAIHRSYNPTVLSAPDRRMCEEIVDLIKPVYTRPDWHNSFKDYPFVKYFPDLPYKGDKKQDQPFHWGSGPYAAYLACLSDATEMHFLGFDLFSPNGFHNNIYKGSIHYEDETYRAVDPSFWIHQLQQLFEVYDEKTFTFVYPDGWPHPQSWTHSNVKYINYDKFKKTLDGR